MQNYTEEFQDEFGNKKSPTCFGGFTLVWRANGEAMLVLWDHPVSKKLLHAIPFSKIELQVLQQKINSALKDM